MTFITIPFIKSISIKTQSMSKLNYRQVRDIPGVRHKNWDYSNFLSIIWNLIIIYYFEILSLVTDFLFGFLRLLQWLVTAKSTENLLTNLVNKITFPNVIQGVVKVTAIHF